MTEQEKCLTFLIDDTPADTDAFGPHQRVADAIADLIESSEKGGKVIGLEGGWGAGKSTVVRFLVKRLSKNDNYRVISFDAWAHEGDPLRRTYLETLIQELRATKWVDDATWEKRRDEIAHRRKETTTRITPKPTSLGVALAVSLLLVPLGSAFLSEGLRTGVTIGRHLPPNWLFIVGLLLALSPFWVLLANLVRVVGTRLQRRLQGKQGAQELSSHGSASTTSEWAFLFSRAINETRTETIESANPTSIEFEDYFTRLMRESLGDSKERRCLLVLDNLDRVDPDSALAIWSTLQTFLQDRNHRNEDWFRRLWVVVPFDPDGLRKLWDKRSSGDDSTTPTGVNESVASDSFLDKSFQVRFHVPPPVLSDWKAYVYGLVEEALPNHGQEDRHWIYRVFDHCRTRTGEPPTPRELKLYVNQIGAIHRQWGHKFPIQHVAYYVLHRRVRKSIIERLRGKSAFPSEQDTAFLGQDLHRSLAGLAFNVEPDKGIELLLAEPVYQSLADGDSAKLKQLEESNSNGFWAVLEIVATSKLDDTDAQTVAKAASCLKDSGILEDNHRHETSNILSGLRSAGEKITKWSPFDLTTAKGLSALCSLCGTPELSASVMKTVASTLEPASRDSETNSDPQSVIEPLLAVMQQLASLGHQSAIPQSLTLPITAEAWPAACDFLAKTDVEGKFWKHIRPKADFAAVSGVIEPTVSTGKFKEPEITTIRVTSSSPIKSSWKVVVNEIRQRLDASVNVSPKEAQSLYRGLFVLRSLHSAEAINLLKELADNGHTLHHFQQANAGGHHDCKAICLFAFLLDRPGAVKPGTAGNSDTGYENLMSTLTSNDADMANRLMALLREYGEIDLLLKIASARSKYDPLICLGLRDVAESKEAEQVLTPLLVLESWKDLRSALNDSSDEHRFTTLVGRLAHCTSLCQSIQDAENGFATTDLELYLAIIRGAKEELPNFAQWCKEGIEHLSKDEWVAQLTGDFPCCRLALNLAEQGMVPVLKTGFSDALATHAQSVLSGKHVPPDDLLPVWRNLLDCLSNEATRKELRTRLIEAAASRDGKLHASFFELYGNEIDEADCLAANYQIVSHLFSPILRERNAAALKWLDRILATHNDLLDKVSDETTVEAFTSRLRDNMTEVVKDDVQPVIEQIAAKIGVEAATNGAEVSDDGDDDADERDGKTEQEGQ